MSTEKIMKIRKRVVCIALILIVAFSAMFMTACKNKDKPEKNDGAETTVQAADPMTDEEREADDSDGCIEDSEDLLY